MPSEKDTVLGHQEGDAFAPHKKSAQEELAEFQLLKEKMMIRSLPDSQISASARRVLGAMSEVELLQMSIAEKLSTDPDYSQSTAEYEQLVRVTGATSYIGMAKYLANEIYEIKRGQYLLGKFSKDTTIESLAARRLEEPTLFSDPLGTIASLLGPRGGSGT